MEKPSNTPKTVLEIVGKSSPKSEDTIKAEKYTAIRYAIRVLKEGVLLF